MSSSVKWLALIPLLLACPTAEAQEPLTEAETRCLSLGTIKHRQALEQVIGPKDATDWFLAHAPDTIVGLACNIEMHRKTRVYLDCAEAQLVAMLKKQPKPNCVADKSVITDGPFCVCGQALEAYRSATHSVVLRYKDAAFAGRWPLKTIRLQSGPLEQTIPLAPGSENFNSFSLRTKQSPIFIHAFEAVTHDGVVETFSRYAVLDDGSTALGGFDNNTTKVKEIRVRLSAFGDANVPAVITVWGHFAEIKKYEPPKATPVFNDKPCKGRVCKQNNCSGECEVFCAATMTKVGNCKTDEGCPSECGSKR